MKMEVCQTCGSKGYSSLLIHCVQCDIVGVHRYCVETGPIFDGKNFVWTCEDCIFETTKDFLPSRRSERLNSIIDRETLRRKARQKWRRNFKPLESIKESCMEEKVMMHAIYIDQKSGDVKDSNRDKTTYNIIKDDCPLLEQESEHSFNNWLNCGTNGVCDKHHGEIIEKHCTTMLDCNDKKAIGVAKGIANNLDVTCDRRQSCNKKSKSQPRSLRKRRLVNPIDSDEGSNSMVIDDIDITTKRQSCNSNTKGQSRKKRRRLVLYVDDDEESNLMAFGDKTSSSEISESESLKLKKLIHGIDSDEEINNTMNLTKANGGYNILYQMKQMDHHNRAQLLPMKLFDNEFTASTFITSQVGHTSILPVMDSIWSGTFGINFNGSHVYLGIEAHLPKIASPIVAGATSALPTIIDFDVKPRREAWPKAFVKSPPKSENIGLFFLPIDERNEIFYEIMLGAMGDQHLLLRSKINNLELLVFSSQELPKDLWRFRRKYYMWGVFKPVEESISAK